MGTPNRQPPAAPSGPARGVLDSLWEESGSEWTRLARPAALLPHLPSDPPVNSRLAWVSLRDFPVSLALWGTRSSGSMFWLCLGLSLAQFLVKGDAEQWFSNFLISGPVYPFKKLLRTPKSSSLSVFSPGLCCTGAVCHWLARGDCLFLTLFSDITLVAWNLPRWEYLQYGNWQMLHIRGLLFGYQLV